MAARFIAPLLIVAALLPWLAFAGRAEPTCPTGPIPLDRLNAAIAAATPTTVEATIPTGIRTATSEEASALRAVMESFVTCSDMGEPLRVLAIYTDRYLGDLHYRQGQLTANQYASLAHPDPADLDKRTHLLSIAKIEALADGRVAGEVVIQYAVIPTPKRFLVTVARIDGAWRIDDIFGELTFALP